MIVDPLNLVDSICFARVWLSPMPARLVVVEISLLSSFLSLLSSDVVHGRKAVYFQV